MTSFDDLIERCARKLEKDSELFTYYNVSASEAETLIREQITGYLYDAIDRASLLTNENAVDNLEYKVFLFFSYHIRVDIVYNNDLGHLYLPCNY